MGDFTKSFPYMKHTRIAALMGSLGPFGVFVAIFCSLTDSHKLTFKPKPLSKEERWEEFKKAGFEVLGRDHFERVFG